MDLLSPPYVYLIAVGFGFAARNLAAYWGYGWGRSMAWGVVGFLTGPIGLATLFLVQLAWLMRGRASS
ncbi:hypothetical protein [Amorphus sp. 3PC139-8]|uniref:hypothetical protein n=1 Tax=Amorphus sp. 3PC139-8 TaxID=2735676 RepID=UPI00345D672C